MKRRILNFKEVKKMIGTLAVIVLLASCGEKKKEAPATEQAAPVVESAPPESAGIAFDKEALNAFFSRYLELGEALVASDPTRAKQIAAEIQQISLEGMPEVTETIAELAKSDHLGPQRDIFFTLNKALLPYMENHLRSGAIYQQYCPMAFDNTGAFWFSDSQEILNPYFGDAMLRCGKVEKTYGAL